MIKSKIKPIVLLMTGLLWGGFVQAQESVNASGGNATGSGGTVAYSIGEMFYTSDNSTTGTVDKGVQHAYEIYTVDIKEQANTNIALSVYPNPTVDQLTLTVIGVDNDKLSYRLYDIQGKLLLNAPINANETHIDMQHFPKATYFINVINQKSEQLKSFKIIKN